MLQISHDGSQQLLKPHGVVAAEWLYGYAPVIRLKMTISGRHVHIHNDKTDISKQILSHWYYFEAQLVSNNIW